MPVKFDPVNIDFSCVPVMLVELCAEAHSEFYGDGGDVPTGTELQEFWAGIDSDGTIHYITVVESQFGNITPLNRELWVEF